MKKLILGLCAAFLFTSCGDAKLDALKKDFLNDSNELCRCGISIRKGERLQECGKIQEEVRGKYKEYNDLLIKLDNDVKGCLKENGWDD